MSRYWMLRIAAGAALVATTACIDRGNPAAPTAPAAPLPGGPPALQALACTVAVRSGMVACDGAVAGDGLPRNIILGGQNTFVRVESDSVRYDADLQRFTFDVTIRNLTPQPLGTADGTTLHPEGVRIFFSQLPTVTAGTGTVTVVADGTALFTAGAQPYYQYDEVLSPQETSPVRRWRFDMPPTVETFAFLVLVSAAVPLPDGWIELAAEHEMNDWPGTSEIPVTVRTAAGTSRCGRIAVDVEAADTTIAVAEYATPAPGGACSVAVQARAQGSTWVRVRAGTLADSLLLRVTPTTYEATFTPPAQKHALTLAQWTVAVHTDEGVPVSGVPIAFEYVETYQLDHVGFMGNGIDTIAGVTGIGGEVVLERRLPSTFYMHRPGQFAYPRGWVRTRGRLPDGTAFEVYDTTAVVPGPPVRMQIEVTAVGSCGGFSPGLYAVAYDANSQPTAPAPTFSARPGALTKDSTSELFWWEPSLDPMWANVWRTGYRPSEQRYAYLAAGRDTARVTVQAPGLAPRTVDLVRAPATPCPPPPPPPPKPPGPPPNWCIEHPMACPPYVPANSAPASVPR